MRKDPDPPKIIKVDPADVKEKPTFRTFLPNDDEEEEAFEGFGGLRGVTLFTVLDKPEYHAAMPGDFLHLEGLKYRMVGRQYIDDGVIFQTDCVGRIPLNEF